MAYKNIREYIIDEMSFDITKDGGYSKISYESYTFILKVTNHSALDKEFKLRARYTSILYGLMIDDYMDSFKATYVRFSTFEIKKGSFGFITVNFTDIKEVRDGDRMELEINENTKLLLIRNNGEWLVIDKQIKPSGIIIHPELVSRIEHFEAIEDRMGITIQNFNVRESYDGTLYIDFEILATKEKYYKKLFFVYAVIYDSENNIVKNEHAFIHKDGFNGYGKFSVKFYNFDFPISEIGLIRVYP